MKINILPRWVSDTAKVERVAPVILVHAAGGTTPTPEAAAMRTGAEGFAVVQVYQE
jgi:hypothetical protein